MSLPLVRATALGALATLPLFAAPIELGKQVFHKDWVAACDNTLSCEAMSLDGNSNSETSPTIRVIRSSEKDASAEVKISLVEPKGGLYRLTIDGRTVISGTMDQGEYSIQAKGDAALKLTRAMGRGRKLVVYGSDKAPIGELMLNGTAAVFTHIDVVQNRARTRTALFAVGKKLLPPKSAATPVIVAQRIGKQDVIPDTGSIVGLVENSTCASARTGVTEDIAYSLGKHGGVYKALTLVSCGDGAHNYVDAPFIGTSKDGKKWSFAPAHFDYTSEAGAVAEDIHLLATYSWDAENQRISSYNRGRNVGDCGFAETYVWDGGMFRLVDVFAMEQCRGSTEWMRLWRAKVEFRN